MHLIESNIPEFLRSSPYLQSLLSNGPFPEEGLEIPDGSGKQDLTVNSKEDLIELLSTLRFWLVPEVAEHSSDLLRFALLPVSQTDFIEVAAEFKNYLPLVDELWQIANSEDVTKLKIAAEAAGRGGHFECAKYIVDNASAKQNHIMVCACREAARRGHLVCVKQMLVEWGEQYYSIVMHEAAVGGWLEMLQYMTTLLREECEVMDAMAVCAKKGHLECLEHLHSLGYEKDCRLTIFSAEAGHLDCLKFLHEYNYPAIGVCFDAARHGRLECLQCAHEQGMYWDENTCAVAAEEGHLACLQYAREHGCPWWDGPAVADLPVNDRNIHCTNKTKVAAELEDDLGELIAATACRAPTIDCLLYVLEQGAALSSLCASNSAGSGSLATLQFLHARGFTWEESDSKAAVESQSLECVRFLHEIGTPWDAR